MSRSTRGGDRGLTPVVGIVLLVAITLLLAATVAAFTLGLGETAQSDRLPTVAIGYEFDSKAGAGDELRVVHKSGQAVAVDAIEVVVSGAGCEGGADDPNGRFDLTDFPGMTAGGTLVAGKSFEIDGTGPVACTAGGTLTLRSAVVRVVWIGPSGSSAMLSTWNAPG